MVSLSNHECSAINLVTGTRSAMLQQGQTLTLLIEKPAVGGRMIARVDGQIVLVGGAVPGERVSARVERVGKGVAYAETVAVDEPSPDRRDPHGDPLCGGCLYAHIAYHRQLEIKSQVIADAFARIGRLHLPASVSVAASPADGYRMRARLHRRGRGLGFFREGSHDLCDARATGQLLPATCDVLDRLGEALALLPADTVREVEVSENVDASERVVHLQTAPDSVELSPGLLSSVDQIAGLTVSAPAGCRVLMGSAHVTDRLLLGEANIHVRRHVLAFFQGNRFLLRQLVEHVIETVPEKSTVIDLYAGGGLFAVAAARLRHVRVTAVEGDRVAADDLVANASSTDGAVIPVHQSVEAFARSAPRGVEAVIVDPPRTGLSKDALDGVVRLRAGRVVYVSCDVATLARDARRLVDAGYAIARVAAFDLFPNTPHVETVIVFET
jgi:23S rRNA (uracil1939-C5)-methyltransferase